ncbi:MAG: sugar transferase [Bacteroidia bacterium]
MTAITIRLIDFTAALIGIIVLSPVLLVLTLIGVFDTGSPFFLQSRIGKNQKEFTLIKFRTMFLDTPSKGTHEVSSFQVTKYGQFLRRTKLDELPQLWNVLIGSMSLVGPRPCLPVQIELIQKRNKKGVFNSKPGITGLAQTKNIDMSTPELLALTDAEMIKNWSIQSYFRYIFMTLSGKGQGDAINA